MSEKKKTGYLFPEIEKSSKKKSSRTPKARRRRRKSASTSALLKIRTTKDRPTRRKIIKGIAQSQVSWSHEILIHALEDPHEKIRDFIIEHLGQQENLDLNLIYQKIHSPPWYVKTSCLKILGMRKETSSIKHIEPLANDTNIEVRRTVAVVLGEIGSKQAIPSLSKLSKDTSPFVRMAAQQSLRKAGHPKFS